MTISPWAAIRSVVFGVSIVSAFVACFRTAARTAPPPRWSADLPPLRLDGDTGLVDTIAYGALHRSFVVRPGPQAIHVLDIDLAACWSPFALKGSSGATGRTKTSALIAPSAAPGVAVAGGVNADFFLFDPPGVPRGAHVSGGVVVTGPVNRPVFAVSPEGRAWIGTLGVTGMTVSGLDSIPIVAWNRVEPAGLAWLDARYGSAVDTMTGVVRVVMSGLRGQVLSIDSGRTPTTIPSSGGVLVLGPRAPAAVRARLVVAARSRGRFETNVRLQPIHPREAVGGFPELVRDSLEVPGLDSAGGATFGPVRHPRTMVGVASAGRRLLLVTIDGRQAGYSVGTTLRETARIALSLGATQAINLDGGGSTTMVVARQRGDSTAFEVVNKPSDAQGERPVGNALGVVRTVGRACRG